jgi:hypothetical protein
MAKILCVPVTTDDSWNAPIAAALEASPLWALVDEVNDPSFVENPISGDVLDIDKATAALWMLGASGVVAPGSGEDFSDRLLGAGIVVVGAPRAVTLGQIRRAWISFPLPVFQPAPASTGDADLQEGGSLTDESGEDEA